VDHDSYDNAVVVEQADEVGLLTITVTNTFDAPPTTVGPTTSATQPPAPLPNTGAPVTRMLLIAGFLLAAGVGLVVLTRRRRGSH
jgi:LPXTG-motif cell wall-anchored protein